MNVVDPQYVNQILHCDCVEGMRRLPVACIPFTLTSPPYENLREYGGHPFEFEAVANELYRITMPGGVLVWVVQNQIVDGGESAESFRQCLYFLGLGFRLHNTIIMARNGQRLPSHVRYGPPPEYAFVLSKGRPRTVNLFRDRLNSTAGDPLKKSVRHRDGSLVTKMFKNKLTPQFGQRTSVWFYDVGFNKSTTDRFAFQHPALMPEAMAEDLILSWSQPGDLVFDPMCGAGTTCKLALLNNRHYLGMEVIGRYCEIARERVRLAQEEALSKDGFVTRTFK